MDNSRTCYPSAFECLVTWAFLAVLVLLLAGLMSGCAVPPKAADQIRVDTAAADRVDTVLWPSLSDEQQHQAYHRMRRGVWVLREVLLDEPTEDPALRAELDELLKGAR